jgi:membrane protein required for colicin V production
VTNYAYIDIALTVIGVLLVIRGWTRGFVKEFFAVGAPIIGIIAGVLFYKSGGAFLRTKVFADVKDLPEVLAFIALFFIGFLLCRLVQKIVNDVINGMKLDSLNKLLGALFGLAESFAIIALVVFIVRVQPLFDPDKVIGNSVYAKMVLPFIDKTPLKKFDLNGAKNAVKSAKTTAMLLTHYAGAWRLPCV